MGSILEISLRELASNIEQQSEVASGFERKCGKFLDHLLIIDRNIKLFTLFLGIAS
jgi:hypothetical protein